MSTTGFEKTPRHRLTRALLEGQQREEEARLLVEDDYTILDNYWLIRDHAHAVILEHPSTKNPEYHVIEPQLTENERAALAELKKDIRDRVLYRVEPDVDDPVTVLRENAIKKLDQLPRFNLSDYEFERVMYFMRRDLLGRGKIEALMNDTNLEEVSCNGISTPIYVYHREYDGHLETNLTFADVQGLEDFISKLAQRASKDISSASPTQGTNMPDGSRIQLVRKEISGQGSFTIRKFREEPFTPPELVQLDTCTIEQLAYLWLLIENERNGLVVGGTGSGKTTMLNALSLFIPPRKKIVSIEDTRELKLPHENWSTLVTREAHARDEAEVGMFDLLRYALRMRPDYLPVGEVRGVEAQSMFQAMATGHVCHSTLHADSMETVLNRLREDPINVADSLIPELDFVCIQTKTEIGGTTARRTSEIREVLNLETQNGKSLINHAQIFDRNPSTDELTGEPKRQSTFIDELRRQGQNPHESLDRRYEVLEHLVEEDITDYESVSLVTQAFMNSPEIVVDQVRDGELDKQQLSELQ